MQIHDPFWNLGNMYITSQKSFISTLALTGVINKTTKYYILRQFVTERPLFPTHKTLCTQSVFNHKKLLIILQNVDYPHYLRQTHHWGQSPEALYENIQSGTADNYLLSDSCIFTKNVMGNLSWILALRFLEKNLKEICFQYIAMVSPLKRACIYSCTNLKVPHLRLFYIKFGLNWSYW